MIGKYEALEVLLNLIPPMEVEVPSDVETVYVYGIGHGQYFTALEGWLKEKREHHLIFLEDDLEALRQVFSHPLFSHPQVEVEFAMNPKEWALHIEPLTQKYPSSKIAVFATGSYRKRSSFSPLQLQLKRMHTLSRGLFLERLHMGKLCRNLLPNIARWSSSKLYTGFKEAFEGVPAVICGAGPSLGRLGGELGQLKDKALLIAGGSAMGALSHLHITPHIGVAFDPNDEELDRLQKIHSFDFPLFYGSRLLPEIFPLLKGTPVYLRSHTGGPIEEWFEDQVEIDALSPLLGLSRESLSVTTAGLALALYMGCNPIFLAGVDLCYTGGKRYADGILSPKENRVKGAIKKKGKMTCVEWIMESDAISAFALDNPSTTFYNLSSEGFGFSGVDTAQLSSFTFPSTNLKARVEELVKKAPYAASEDQLKRAFALWRKSLERALENPEDIREVSYLYFTAPVASAVETELKRKGRTLEGKWDIVRSVIKECLNYIPN